MQVFTKDGTIELEASVSKKFPFDLILYLKRISYVLAPWKWEAWLVGKPQVGCMSACHSPGHSYPAMHNGLQLLSKELGAQ